MLRSGLTVEHGHGLSSLFAYTYLVSYPFEGGTLSPASATGKQPEHRALEQLQFEHRLVRLADKHVMLTHRFRVEQRWLGTATEGVGVTNWNFAERARYRMTAKIPFKAVSWPIVPHYASAFDEVYTSFGPHSARSTRMSTMVHSGGTWVDVRL